MASFASCIVMMIFIFCNPVLRKFIKLPACPLGIPHGCHKISEHSGFENDPITNDYKVIRLVTMTPNKRYGHQAFVVRADNAILCFNITNEVFREIEYLNLSIGSRGENSVTILEESLILISSISGNPKLFSPAYDYNTSIKVWVMKEYGVRESWTKKFSTAHLPEINCQLSFWNNDEELFTQIKNGRVDLHGISAMAKSFGSIRCTSRPTNHGFPTYLSVVTYTESLISLNAERNHCLLLPPSRKVTNFSRIGVFFNTGQKEEISIYTS
ncbi:uncharacterized protein [Coffea arabica]|uniref:F-box associated domain-containing protein n=1 Tax=Coffea arabica TaxID=13443 RepID=A0ABM4UFQ0_COFAR